MPRRPGVVLDPRDAGEFIAGYKEVLFRVQGVEERDDERTLETLVAGRRRATENPLVLERAISELEATKQPPNGEVLAAIRSLIVADWVYVRDLKNYSVFVHASGDFALGVLGLTQPVRDIVGGAGAAIEVGVVRYRGRYVCDGLVSRIIQLGPSFRRSFSDAYRMLRKEGRFEATCTHNNRMQRARDA